MSKQLTLIAFYGEKKDGLRELVKDLHRCLTDHLGSRFMACEPEQVHATIARLEGVRVGEHVVTRTCPDMSGH